VESTKFQRTGIPAISSDTHQFARTNRLTFASCLKSSASSALLGFVVSLMSPPFIARALVEVDGIDGNYSSDVLAARPSRSVARRPRVAEFTTIQTGRRVANDEKKKSRLRDFLIFLSFAGHDSTTPPPRQVSRAFSPVRARDVDHARVADRCRAIARRVASRRVGTRRRARAPETSSQTSTTR
jgi:hypothetical protein